MTSTDALLRGSARDPSFAVRAACLQAFPAGGPREDLQSNLAARARRQGQGVLRGARRPLMPGDGPATNDGGGGPSGAAAQRTEQAVSGC